jgi:hypothetical protein
MADDNFIGTTLTFGTAIAKPLAASCREDGGSVDLGYAGAALKLTGDDVPVHEITFRCRGNPDIHVGDTPAALTLAWQDGSTDGASAATWRVANRETNGQTGSGMETSLTFQPATLPA